MDGLDDFDAALLEDGFLDACLATDEHDDLRQELVRNDSSASDASTVLLSAPSVGPGVRIKAFCRFNMFLVDLWYPEAGNGWVYRADIGGPSHHRWEYGDAVFLTSRHATCTKGMVQRNPCRNCVMKSVWRRECIEPCNVFYIDPQQTAEAYNAALKHLVLSAVPATPREVSEYTLFAPKPCAMRKRALDTNDKLLRNARSLENLRQNVASVVSVADDEGEQQPPPKLFQVPVQTTVVTPSPQRPVTSLLSSPKRHITVAAVYESLVTCLLKVDASSAVSLPLASFRLMVAQHTPTFVEHAMLTRSIALDKLGTILGVPDTMQLLMKAVLAGWLRTLCETFCTAGEAEVHVGFYVPPTIGFYRDLFNESLMPSVMRRAATASRPVTPPLSRAASRQ